MEAVAERQSKALPAAWIDRLFERLTLAYGTDKLQALFRGQEVYAAKAYWAEELSTCSADELRAGFEAMKREHPTWPPTLFEFKALCRPTANSINAEAAFYEAVRGLEQRRRGEPGTWSHRAIYWAASDVSPFDILGSTWPQIRNRWTKALEARLADPNLPLVPEPPKLLPEAPRDPGLAAELVESITAQLASAVKPDPRAWARRVVARRERGEDVPEGAYQMALSALQLIEGQCTSEDSSPAATEARRETLRRQFEQLQSQAAETEA